jgi:hypothetical protein
MIPAQSSTKDDMKCMSKSLTFDQEPRLLLAPQDIGSGQCLSLALSGNNQVKSFKGSP